MAQFRRRRRRRRRRRVPAAESSLALRPQRRVVERVHALARVHADRFERFDDAQRAVHRAPEQERVRGDELRADALMRRRLLSLLAAPGVMDRTWHRRARGSAGRPTRRRPRSRVLRARNAVVALAADEYRVHRRRGRRRVVPREAFARHRSSRGNELFHRLPLFERITAPWISASFPAPGAAVARASRVDVRDVDAEHSAGTTTTRARQRRRVRRRVRRPRARVVQKYTTFSCCRCQAVGFEVFWHFQHRTPTGVLRGVLRGGWRR